MTTDRTAKPPVTSLSFEEALGCLQDVVLNLEGGTLTLDDTIATFRHGSELATHCQRLIAEAELRVSELSSHGDAAESNNSL